MNDPRPSNPSTVQFLGHPVTDDRAMIITNPSGTWLMRPEDPRPLSVSIEGMRPGRVAALLEMRLAQRGYRVLDARRLSAVDPMPWEKN